MLLVRYLSDSFGRQRSCWTANKMIACFICMIKWFSLELWFVLYHTTHEQPVDNLSGVQLQKTITRTLADSSLNLKINRALCFLSVSFHPHSKHLFYISLKILQRNSSYLVTRGTQPRKLQSPNSQLCPALASPALASPAQPRSGSPPMSWPPLPPLYWLAGSSVEAGGEFTEER